MNLKRIGVSCAVLFLLAGCGIEKGTSDIDNHILYSNDEVLKHDMEGVNVEMTYFVDDSTPTTENTKQNSIKEDAIFVQGTVILTNETANTIYYTPSFYAVDKKGNRYENMVGMNEKQIVLPLGEKNEFQIGFILSKSDYQSLSELEVTVPVPFLEPNSESSGDALGDTTTWVLQIKE